MGKQTLSLAFLLGALAVAFGAFGAHALKELVDEKSIQTWQTGVQYHFYHVFALVITGLLLNGQSLTWFKRAAALFTTGIIIFSGSLYAMTLFKAAGFTNMNWLGAVTPIGGGCFIAGWICLFIGARK